MRIVTAIYRTHAAAAAVHRRLMELGLGERAQIVPDTYAPLGPLGIRDDAPLLGALRDLDLPDEDLRAYRGALRRGDYLVSVAADVRVILAVIAVMRSPERAVAAAAGGNDADCVDLNAYRRDRGRAARRRGTPNKERKSQ